MSAPSDKHVQLACCCDKMVANIPQQPDPTARDWAGFFKALGEFAAMLLPLILPLFVATDEKNTD